MKIQQTSIQNRCWSVWSVSGRCGHALGRPQDAPGTPVGRSKARPGRPKGVLGASRGVQEQSWGLLGCGKIAWESAGRVPTMLSEPVRVAKSSRRQLRSDLSQFGRVVWKRRCATPASVLWMSDFVRFERRVARKPSKNPAFRSRKSRCETSWGQSGRAKSRSRAQNPAEKRVRARKVKPFF